MKSFCLSLLQILNPRSASDTDNCLHLVIALGQSWPSLSQEGEKYSLHLPSEINRVVQLSVYIILI